MMADGEEYLGIYSQGERKIFSAEIHTAEVSMT